jgi:hypothetical protein
MRQAIGYVFVKHLQLNVAEPLLALGKLLKKGWKVETENDEVKLKFGEFTKVLNLRNHCLIAEASVRKVFNVDTKNVRVVAMAFQALMRDLVGIFLRTA